MLNRPYETYGLTEKYEGEDPKGLLAAHIVKNRSGELGMIPYSTDMKHFNIWERPELIRMAEHEDTSEIPVFRKRSKKHEQEVKW